jgi:hypothetical protein
LKFFKSFVFIVQVETKSKLSYKLYSRGYDKFTSSQLLEKLLNDKTNFSLEFEELFIKFFTEFIEFFLESIKNILVSSFALIEFIQESISKFQELLFNL